MAELNADLISLGYATSSELTPSDYFSSATAAALEALQGALDVPTTGSLALGQAVFLPTPARITSVTAVLGASPQAGSQVLAATSITRSVTATIDPADVSRVDVGDPVTIILRENQTTPGTIASIGTTATPASNADSGSGTSTPPTVNIAITPTDTAATGVVDQAPVTVTVTTATVQSVLAVPVAALLTTSAGRPAVEVVAADHLTHLVPITPGLFDDANGLIQIGGTGLQAGQHVLLPSDTTRT